MTPYNYNGLDWAGFTYLGPPQIPPEASWVGMTDRDTGVIWYLCFDPCYAGRIALVSADEIPFTKLIVTRVYAPYDGPYIINEGLRLGVRNGHLLFDTQVGSGAAPPWAFDLSGSHNLWLQLYPRSLDNPNTWDHLAYDGIPWFFFGLTDRDTQQVWYVVLDHTSGRIGLLDALNVPGPIRSRVHVYRGFQGPGIGTTGLQLGVRGGRMLFEGSTKQFTLLPSMAFDSWGQVGQAALFAGALVNGQFGIADQLPDHVSYSVVNPVTNECPGGPQSIDSPRVVLVTDEDWIILSDDDEIQIPD